MIFSCKQLSYFDEKYQSFPDMGFRGGFISRQAQYYADILGRDLFRYCQDRLKQPNCTSPALEEKDVQRLAKEVAQKLYRSLSGQITFSANQGWLNAEEARALRGLSACEFTNFKQRFYDLLVLASAGPLHMAKLEIILEKLSSFGYVAHLSHKYSADTADIFYFIKNNKDPREKLAEALKEAERLQKTYQVSRSDALFFVKTYGNSAERELKKILPEVERLAQTYGLTVRAVMNYVRNHGLDQAAQIISGDSLT